ncbi:uncharacterized protein LOC125028863 isoform X2 [Penaeus chinensis]|uniref:uncharacterized protein LOC125028863 isoform X2 n=1 Tax=Penaeus chinensis TaxID=139456 RepID=UPI001FB8503F|nr:uncharacterized protein LOC125028863 isoform X2 [Penaeus chinensis]
MLEGVKLDRLNISCIGLNYFGNKYWASRSNQVPADAEFQKDRDNLKDTLTISTSEENIDYPQCLFSKSALFCRMSRFIVIPRCPEDATSVVRGLRHYLSLLQSTSDPKDPWSGPHHGAVGLICVSPLSLVDTTWLRKQHCSVLLRKRPCCWHCCSCRMGNRFYTKLFIFFVVCNSIWIIYPPVVQWREALAYGKLNRTENGSPQTPLSEQRVAGAGGVRGVEWWQKHLCKSAFLEQPEDSKMMDLLMLSRDITPNASDYNVYLGETGCNPRPLYRAWCSVESFALQNPTAKVWYLITSPQVDDTDALVTNLKKRYSNLNVVGADLDKMFTGTPVEKIFKSGKWAHNTPWPANNISNLLRNVLLWLWGGMNVDTDCICVRNVTSLHNVMAYDEIGQIANNAIMHFDAQSPFTFALMSYMKKHFRVSTWHVNGPGTATAVTKQVCNATNMNDVFIKKCSAVTLLPLKNLQIVRWNQWKNFFEGEPEKFIEVYTQRRLYYAYVQQTQQGNTY